MKLLKQKGGFTLIETIAAVAVLVVILLGFTMMVKASSNFNIRAKEFQSEFDEAKQTLSTETSKDGKVIIEVEFEGLLVDYHVKIKQNNMLTSFEVAP